MSQPEPDAVDHHVARWAEYWKDNPKFAPEIEGAITRMQGIVRQRNRVAAATFAGSDFTLEDYETLHVLMVQPYPTEATPAQLAEASKITRASMTSRLDRLAEAGMVTREPDALDRRRILVRPTTRGRKTWDRYVHHGMAREQELLGALSERELKQLNALLRKITRSYEP